MMQLLSRKTNGKLILELTREHVTATHLSDGMKQRSRSVTQSSGKKLDFADSSDLSSRLDRIVRVLSLRGPLKATVCLPRSITCVHVLELPHVGQRDLASAVNLEMESVYGEETGQYVWDFVHIDLDDKTPLYVIVFCVPRRILDGLRTALNQSQIAVERLTLSELGYGQACYPHTGLVHMLSLRGHRLDVIICLRGTVVQFQTFAINSDKSCNFDQIMGTLRRLHASLPESMQTLVPKTMLLLARSNAAQDSEGASEFESSLIKNCETQDFTIEDFSIEELFNLGRRTPRRLDLAHPQKPTAPPMSRGSWARLLLAVVVTAVLAFWGFNQLESSKLAKQIKYAQEKIAESDKKLTALDGQLESAALLNQWDDSNVNWSGQISAISQQFAAAADCYVVRLQMDNQNTLERKPVTRIEGRGKTTEKILQLTRKLSAENPSLAVQPNGIEPNSVDPDFSSQFRIEISEAVGPENALSERSQQED